MALSIVWNFSPHGEVGAQFLQLPDTFLPRPKYAFVHAVPARAYDLISQGYASEMIYSSFYEAYTL